MSRRIIPPYKADSLMLRSYAPNKPVRVPMSLIQKDDFVTTQDASRIWRNRFGRGISMDRIELALISANRGAMRDLSDLSRETIDTDPHLGSVLNKRMGAVSSLPWEVQPAEGIGVEKEKAEYYAEVVREQILNLPRFRQNLSQIAWGLFDGRAILEIDWTKLENPPISHKKYGSPDLFVTGLGWIHPRRISFGNERQLIIEDEIISYSAGNFSAVGLDINTIPYKFMQYTPQRYGEYPEREGLAPRCMYWSFFKRFSARERMILVELFGKPWRVIEVDEDSSAGADELTQADANAEGLGSSYSARMPRGTKLVVHQPQRTAGQVHQAVIEESDRQLSKLVLGQTGTTDGVPAGLNSSQANVMQDEQLMILKMDAAEIQEVVECQLTDPIIALNFGESERPYAPKFLLRSDLPADRNSELDRLDKALKSGLEVGRNEAYEISGFRIPNRDEIIVRMDQPPTPPFAPVAPPPRPILVYPPDSSPEAGEQQPAAPTASIGEGKVDNEIGDNKLPIAVSDVAKVVTVNEARASQGLPPLKGEEGDLTMLQFEAMVSKGKDPEPEPEPPNPEGEPEPPEGEPKPEPPEGETTEDIEEEIVTASKVTLEIKKEGDKWVVYSEDGSKSFGSYDTKEEAEERLRQIEHFKKAEASKVFKQIVSEVEDRNLTAILALSSVQRLFDKHICKGKDCDVCTAAINKQPTTEFGSTETILDRGKSEVYREMDKWVKGYEDAVENKTNVKGVLKAISSADSKIDISKLARALERRMVQSAALGALDMALDIGESVEETEARNNNSPDVLTSVLTLADAKDFSSMRFEDAIRFFKAKKILKKAEFEKLTMAAKQRAFTVAGVQKKQLLSLIRDELTKTISSGADIRKFRKFIEERVVSAGFVPGKMKGRLGSLSAAHTDTVFRTNVLNAYNAGRYEKQSQPEVMIRRPVWEIRAVRDKRTRRYHRKASGTMLLATDPFWKTAYPPFGFNCRCQVITRSKRYLDQVVSGSTIRGLPDPGFSSGVGNI